MLKEQGLKIAILEANRFVHDVSGSTTAKITIPSTLIYDNILSEFGFNKALKFKDANIASFNKIAEIINKYNIDCDYRRIPLYIYSSNQDNLNNFENIEKEYKAANKLGLEAKLTDKMPFPFDKELPNDYFKALLYEDQGEFHPKKYLNALLNKIDSNGSYLFEKTKLINIEDGYIKKIITKDGVVYADHLVIATNAPIYDPDSILSFMSQNKSYIMSAYVEEDLPKGMFVDINPFHTYRTTPTEKGNLLIVAGEHHFIGEIEDTWECFDRLKNFTEDKFNVKSIEYFWSNQDNRTDDLIPVIGETSQKGIYIATGFGFWGMTTGTLAGMIISDLILKNDNSYFEIFDPKRFKGQKSKKKNCLKKFNIKDLNEEESKKLSALLVDMEYGHGKIVNLGNRSIAIYKDFDSNVFGLTPNCTHFLCELRWNDAEKTWDCPQHGSRFTFKGKCVHGPAIDDLKSYLK